MSLSHGKMYIRNVDEDNRQLSPILDIINVPSETQVVSITEMSMEPGSVQHYTSITSLQQDKINNLQVSYNELLNKYQKMNARYMMKLKKKKLK